MNANEQDEREQNSAPAENVTALPRITPEMLALYRKLQSGRMVAVDDEAFLYPSEEYNVMQDIVLALGRLIDGIGEG